MIEFLRRFFLTGLGALTLTKEKIEEIVETLIKKGEITVEEGKQFVKDILRHTEEGKKILEEKIDVGVKKVIERMDLATKKELNDLSEKVSVLEKKIKESTK
ncbi:MAG: hypothetical protein QME40_01795 [bacterium]|nr:hypothetical protein [bacterium]